MHDDDGRRVAEKEYAGIINEEDDNRIMQLRQLTRQLSLTLNWKSWFVFDNIILMVTILFGCLLLAGMESRDR